MTTLARAPAEWQKDNEARVFLLDGIGWDFYERLLRELGEAAVRVTYDQGRLELMSPSSEHEQYKRLIGRLIEIIAYLGNIPVSAFGSSTLRRKDLAKGLEADECYYIQNERHVRRKRRLDLKKDPPPDLVVEIDITHHAVDRERIYASIGVPEIWKFDGRVLTILQLPRGGTYVPTLHSIAFPWLAAEDLQRFVRLQWRVDQTTIVRRFGQWARKRLRIDD